MNVRCLSSGLGRNDAIALQMADLAFAQIQWKQYFEKGNYSTAAEHSPIYLRKSQAERERESKECLKSVE